MNCNSLFFSAFLVSVAFLGNVGEAQPFQLPTANRAVLDSAGGEKAFAGTTGHPWMSGTFGCVRSGGGKFHEGLDIRCLERDRRGEPTDAVRSTADGTVAYVNARSALSNYGNYVVIRHSIEGLEIYSLYAHLGSIQPEIKPGQKVKSGEQIGIMGRTSNTREAISRERAHVHFEVNLVVSDRYSAWHAKTMPESRNDHGNFNGRNLLGMDPWKLLLDQQRLGTNFSLVRHLQTQPEMCRVLVRASDFPWVRRYRALRERNPVADREGIAGYELVLTFNGLPCRIIPRAASQIQSKAKYSIVSVRSQELSDHPCGHLLFRRGQVWTLLPAGERLLDLLTF